MRYGRAATSPRLGFRARAGAALLVVIAAGCTSMSPVKQPQNYIESQQPKVVRITRNNGSKFMMVGARLSGDTLMGFVETKGGAVGEFTEFPFGEVTRVEAQQYAHGKTVLAILGGVLGWAALTAVVIHQVTHVSQ